MSTCRPFVAALVLLATVSMPRPTRATTYQWDGGLSHGTSVDVNWTTGNNWTGGFAPTSSLTGTDVVFLAAAGRTTSNNNNALPVGIAIHSLTFNPGSVAYTLTGNTIYIGTGGLVQNSMAMQTFSGSVGVAAAETWTFGTGAGALNLAGGLNIADGGSLTVSTAGIQFSGNSGLTVGGYNGSDPSGTPSYGASSFTLTGGVTLSPASVTMGQDGTSNTYAQDSGTLNTGAISMGIAGGANFHLSGTGSVSATSLTVGTNTGSTFLQDNGSVTTNGGALIVGNNGSGSYTINAGSISTGSLSVGYLSALGTFNQAGGTVTVTGALGLGAFGRDGNGTFNLSAGQLTVGSITIGTLGTGAFVQTGGTVISSGAISLGNESSASYTLSGANSSVSAPNVSIGTSFGTAIFALNGGTLTVGSVGTNGYSGGTSTFDFNGGTLQANKANTAFVAGLAGVYVQAGGAKINSNGFGITVTSALLHDPALVSSALDGGLAKLGSGTLTLAGANTYNGGTVISGGALEAAVNGALGTGNVMLGPNAFLLTLDASVTNAIADTASLSLDSTVGGKLQLLGAAGSVQEIVASLDFSGVKQPPGTYGATGSGAQFIDNTHFSGTGILAVGVVPEPGTGALAVAGMFLAAVAWGRRRRA